MSKKILWAIIAVMLTLGVAIGLQAPVSHNATARAVGEIAPVSDAWRAALPRDAVKATDMYMARLSPAAKARSDAYFEGGYWLKLFNFLAGLVVAWVLLSSKVLVATRDFAEKRPALKWATVLLTGIVFYLLSNALTTPLDFYQGFYREHLYGLANQTFLPWLEEQLTILAVGAAITGVAIVCIYLVIRRAPQSWWAWGAVGGVGFLSVMLLLGPVYIDPLFNKYKPLADDKVKAPILLMARASGVPADNVYQFDASKQSNRISANVSGIFGTAAVRLNDNLLNRTTVPEIKGVMGHELGHYVLNHIYKELVEFGVILVFGFAFIKWSMGVALRRWGGKFGIRGMADPAGLPLFFALFSAYMFVMTPVMNTIIRVSEVEADIFGLNASMEPDGFAEVDLKLTEYRKSDPSDIEEFLFYDHPSPKKRVFSAMRYKQEHWKGEAPAAAPAMASATPPAMSTATSGGNQPAQ